ncbi:glycosyltransferase family 2 protein [Halalkalibacter alkalisediminis]|uniref:Glycosyltransferase family 2 protein n=1 Tax=Halalkalibacter alkalisediminis TaxID=935616 RepID=A0ABV6NER8_9BACI|nr:glycosyltransferase family 2 protein [Halalkalibacter alkalisediminis]
MSSATEKPLVSIVTPVYNAERFVTETIHSVTAQTYSNWELIVVDDCSNDQSKEIIRSFQEKDDRIKYECLETNMGAAVARNTGIKKAVGKYVAFLDSDDLWRPEKLEKQVAFMEDGQKLFSFTGYQLLNEDGSERGKVISVPKVVTYESLLKNTIIGCLTVMLNIEVLGKVQMPTIRTRQDFVLWLSILKNGHVAYGLQEDLAWYRKVKNSISSNKLNAAKRNWKIYREFENLPFFKACYVFINYAWNGLRKA